MIKRLYRSWLANRQELNQFEFEQVLALALTDDDTDLFTALLEGCWRGDDSRTRVQTALEQALDGTGSQCWAVALGRTDGKWRDELLASTDADVLMRAFASKYVSVDRADVATIWPRKHTGLRLVAYREMRGFRDDSKAWGRWVLRQGKYLEKSGSSMKEYVTEIHRRHEDRARALASLSEDPMLKVWISAQDGQSWRWAHDVEALPNIIEAALERDPSADDLADLAEVLVRALCSKATISLEKRTELVAVGDELRTRLDPADLVELDEALEGSRAAVTQKSTGSIDPRALSAVVADGPDGAGWARMLGNPGLTVFQARELVGSLEHHRVSDCRPMVQALLAGRARAWHVELVELLWRDETSLRHSLRPSSIISARDGFGLLVEALPYETRERVMGSWVRGPSDLSRLEGRLSWRVPESVVLAAPLTWFVGQDKVLTEKSQRILRRTLGQDPANWENFASFSSEFEGSLGELITVATSLAD